MAWLEALLVAAEATRTTFLIVKYAVFVFTQKVLFCVFCHSSFFNLLSNAEDVNYLIFSKIINIELYIGCTS